MDDRVNQIIDKILTLECELAKALSLHRDEISNEIKQVRIEFEAEVLRRQREMRLDLLKYLRNANPWSVITAPIIYCLFLPLVMFDACLTIYQVLCFPVYGIKRVVRGDYLIFDRSSLAYLNPIEKLNCAYCSYANGVIAYAREIGARTEAYWCPIKHARNFLGTHPYYVNFAAYGDAEAYRRVSAPNEARHMNQE